MVKNSIYRILIYFIISSNLIAVKAQVTSNNGRFETEYARGCAPFTVHLNEIDNLGNISRTYTYEPNTNPTSDTFHTFSNPGIYEIIQLVGEDVVPKTDTLIIEVIENKTPSFTSLICDTETVLLRFDSAYYDSYWLIEGADTLLVNQDSEWKSIKSVNNPKNITIQGTIENGAPNCQSISTLLNTPQLIFDLNPIVEFSYQCTGFLSAEIIYSNNDNFLHRISYQTDQNSPIYLSQSLLNQHTLNVSNLSIEDNNLHICINIEVLSACDESVFHTYQICDEINKYDDPVRFTYASFSDGLIEITVDTLSQGRIQINQYADDLFISTTELTGQSITYENIEENLLPKFEIIYYSSCSGDSTTFNVSPAYIKSQKLGINYFQLEFIPPIFYFADNINMESSIIYTGKSDTIRYYTEIPEIRLNVGLGNTQYLQYLTMVDDISLYSNKIPFEYEYYIYIPDAFTPNNDGINDELKLYGLPTDQFDLKIFNRWGEKVFESTDINNLWNGRLKNGHIIEGVYVYRLNFYNAVGEFFTQQGSFAVIRD